MPRAVQQRTRPMVNDDSERPDDADASVGPEPSTSAQAGDPRPEPPPHTRARKSRKSRVIDSAAPAQGERPETETGEPPPITIEEMNEKHCVLPIGGKTRVATWDEDPEFPGYPIIARFATFSDFRALHDKYRRIVLDDGHEAKEVRLWKMVDQPSPAPPVRQRHEVHAGTR